jgi:photosystem II stability/assembly factor-like uncharacterized protein
MEKLYKIFSLIFLSFLVVHCTLKIDNCSAQWFSQSSNTSYTLRGISFLNTSTGWVAGYNGTVLQTTNGGNIWTNQTTNTTKNINSIFFLNYTTGWFAGDSGLIEKTTNGGNSWFNQTSTTSNKLRTILFIDANIGYIIGDGTFLATSNGGSTWVFISDNGGNSIYFTDVNVGYEATSNIIQKTINGGHNWTQSFSGTRILYRVCFTNSNTGYVVGDSGTVVKTTNAGVSWSSQITPVNTIHLFGVSFIDPSNGTAVGVIGKIIHTTNGGLNWNIQNSGLTNPPTLEYVQFLDPNTGWIVGGNGTILKTTNGGVGIKQISELVPKSFSLEQNYPNPFNPSTSIRYELPKSGFIKLVVFDALGREIETLVNEKQSAGTYEATFDGSNYSSGIYFYKLTTNGFNETKRMVLVK